MRVVIDIPDRIYTTILATHDNMIFNSDSPYVAKAIKKGTCLPQGHRFIDADKILRHAHVEEDEEGDIFVKKYYCVEKSVFDNAVVQFDTFGKELANE